MTGEEEKNHWNRLADEYTGKAQQQINGLPMKDRQIILNYVTEALARVSRGEKANLTLNFEPRKCLVMYEHKEGDPMFLLFCLSLLTMEATRVAAVLMEHDGLTPAGRNTLCEVVSALSADWFSHSGHTKTTICRVTSGEQK